MDISRKDSKEEKLSTNIKGMIKKFGPSYAFKVVQRLNEIDAASSAKDLYAARPHTLEKPRLGCISLDTEHPYRLIIKPTNPEANLSDRSTITHVKIISLKTNTHHKGK